MSTAVRQFRSMILSSIMSAESFACSIIHIYFLPVHRCFSRKQNKNYFIHRKCTPSNFLTPNTSFFFFPDMMEHEKLNYILNFFTPILYRNSSHPYFVWNFKNKSIGLVCFIDLLIHHRNHPKITGKRP